MHLSVFSIFIYEFFEKNIFSGAYELFSVLYIYFIIHIKNKKTGKI
jgi:hypothetical protein